MSNKSKKVFKKKSIKQELNHKIIKGEFKDRRGNSIYFVNNDKNNIVHFID